MIPVQIAPMMDVTDRWFRRVMRILAPNVELWTEMVVDHAVLHGDRDQLLGHHLAEQPLVLQVGGDDPARLAEVARIAEGYGYDSLNLNVGCPSARVRSGCFGAVLMKDPSKVAGLVEAMARASSLPVHVKHRIGVDSLDRYADMVNFVDQVAATGVCSRFVVHARKAWLQGLSPKQNRTVPPLRHAEVWRLKAARPDLSIVTNGGLRDTEEVRRHLAAVDGVMIGRAAVEAPWWIASLDRALLGGIVPTSRRQAAEAVRDVVAEAVERGHPPHRVTRHLMHWFTGMPGARAWRRALSERRAERDGGLAAALAALPSETLEAA